MLPPQWSNDRLAKLVEDFVTKNTIMLSCVNACKVFTAITAVACLRCRKLTLRCKFGLPQKSLPPGVPSWLRTCIFSFIIRLRIEESAKKFILFLTKNFILCDTILVSIILYTSRFKHVMVDYRYACIHSL